LAVESPRGTPAPARRTRPRDNDASCEIACVDERQVERIRRRQPSTETFLALAETLRALGDPTRLQIVSALAHGELCVCDLSSLVGVSESAVSHSLRTLRQLRVVRFRRDGKAAYYSLDKSPVSRLALNGLRHLQRG
jgi:DNA-binding transcriptional ArsR family regulator